MKIIENDSTHLIKDLLSGDESILEREDYKKLDLSEIRDGLNLIKNNPYLNQQNIQNLLNNSWRINYRIKPPTIEEFLTDKWIGETADTLYPYLKEVMINYFNPKNDYRHLILACFIGFGKSFCSVLSNLFITVNLWCMRDSKRYFGLSPATTLVQLLISFTEEKAKEILLEPFKNLLGASNKFYRCRTEDSLNRKQKELGDDYICYTTAGTFVLQFTNNLNYKIASSPGKLLGVTAVSATLSELSYFIERGFSYDSIWRMYQDSKTRVYSRLKSHYFARTIIDSSPLDMDLSPIDKYVFSGEAEKKKDKDNKYRNFVVKGSMWEYKTWEFENLNNTFSVYVGGNSQPAKILKNKLEIKDYHPNELLHPPMELKTIFEEDLIRNIRNLGGKPSSSPSKLITNYKIIDEIFDDNLKNIIYGIKAPANEEPKNLIWDQIKDTFFIKINDRYRFYRNPFEIRYIHIDQSETGDITAIGCGHVELTKKGENIYIIDFTICIIPDKNRINLDAISEFVYDLRKLGHMKIGLVSFDMWQSAPTIQRFKRDGFNCQKLSVDSDMAPYLLLVSRIKDGKVKCGKNIWLKNNLKSLQETRTPKGKRKIDHLIGKEIKIYNDNWELDMTGTNAKDTSDVVAGVVYHCINEYKGSPRYIYSPTILEDEEEMLLKIQSQYCLIPKT